MTERRAGTKLILVILLAALALVLAGPASAAVDQELLDWADGFESLKGDFPREGPPTDLVSPYGPRMDASCGEGLSPKATEERQGLFFSAVEESLRKIRACRSELPALPYLSDVVSIMRRTVYICEKRPSATATAMRGRLDGHWTDRIREEQRPEPIATQPDPRCSSSSQSPWPFSGRS